MSTRSRQVTAPTAQQYSAQPTAPSADGGQARAERALGISWVGPRSETLETELAAARVRIGREPSNDLVLSGNEVSRTHAEITRAGATFTLADLGSRNGVIADGHTVPAVILRDGLVLRLGEWIGVVRPTGAGPLRELAPGLWGSGRLESALKALRIAAKSPLSLVVAGETGTGKELVARAVYEWSGVRGPFVPVNCAALSESLVEAELFGHVRGAFTGAVTDRPGHLREADNGLLFLDEIGELPLPAQAKLLRALQEQEVTPVGTSQRIRVRLRVLAASHRNLREMVKAGTFRADLLARLEGLVVQLPPLRERREDIIPLFLHFVQSKLGRPSLELTPELALRLALYEWPGNARELKQLADRAAVLHAKVARFGIGEVDVPAPSDAREERPAEGAARPGERHKRRPEPQDVANALAAAQGVVSRAAQNLGISKQTLYKLIEEYGVDMRPYRPKSRA